MKILVIQVIGIQLCLNVNFELAKQRLNNVQHAVSI